MCESKETFGSDKPSGREFLVSWGIPATDAHDWSAAVAPPTGRNGGESTEIFEKLPVIWEFPGIFGTIIDCKVPGIWGFPLPPAALAADWSNMLALPTCCC